MDDSKIICGALQSRMEEGVISEFTPAENEHLILCDACAEQLTERMLQEPPVVSIPAGFAARVRSQLSAEHKEPAIRRWAPDFGFVIAVTVLLLAAFAWIVLLFAAPQRPALGGLTSVLALCTFTCEIAGIGLWLGVRVSSE